MLKLIVSLDFALPIRISTIVFWHLVLRSIHGRTIGYAPGIGLTALSASLARRRGNPAVSVHSRKKERFGWIG